MKFTDTEVKHLADLSSLSVDDRQIASLSTDLSQIIAYFDEMNAVDTEGIDPTYQVTGLENVWREDEIQPHISREQLLALAPATRDDCIQVPRVL